MTWSPADEGAGSRTAYPTSGEYPLTWRVSGTRHRNGGEADGARSGVRAGDRAQRHRLAAHDASCRRKPRGQCGCILLGVGVIDEQPLRVAVEVLIGGAL